MQAAHLGQVTHKPSRRSSSSSFKTSASSDAGAAAAGRVWPQHRPSCLGPEAGLPATEAPWPAMSGPAVVAAFGQRAQLTKVNLQTKPLQLERHAWTMHTKTIHCSKHAEYLSRKQWGKNTHEHTVYRNDQIYREVQPATPIRSPWRNCKRYAPNSKDEKPPDRTKSKWTRSQ